MSFALERLSTASLALQTNPKSSPTKASYVKVAQLNREDQPNPKQHARWRSWTLHPISLGLTVVFTLVVIAILEYLQRRSDAEGGLVFANTRDQIPTGLYFLYLSFPTVIAVLYSLWWSWIDLDVKRLEPWYQLTNQNSFKSLCPLLLQYPVEFVAWVPIRAAKRRYYSQRYTKTLELTVNRQWRVVVASLGMVIVFWAVTPLQSAIFRIAPTTVRRETTIARPMTLAPLKEQRRVLGGNLPNAAYGVVWLNQTLPPFTTRNFALAPWSLDSVDPDRQNATMTADTTLYRADLQCFNAASVVSPENGTDRELIIDDGRGCKEKIVLGDTLTDRQSNGFQNSACQKYVFTWQTRQAPYSDVSSLLVRLCETSYYTQPVRANISLPHGSVVETWPLGPQARLSETELNTTLLEYVVGIGIAPGSGRNYSNFQDVIPRSFDISEDTVITQSARVEQRGFPAVSSILVGIAVGGQNLTFDRFMEDEAARDEALRAAQQLFFALAVSKFTQINDSPEGSHPITVTFAAISIQLVSAITHTVQAFLGIIAILTVILVFNFYSNFLPFESGPDTIAFVVALASRKKFLDAFKALDRVQDLSSLFGNRRAGLSSMDGSLALTLYGPEPEEDSETSRKQSRLADGDPQYVTPATRYRWPTELKTPTVFAMVLALALAAATLMGLDNWTRSHQGLPVPSESSGVQQLVLNYVPTVFGTLVEPLLVVICRLLCFIQPFQDLKRGPKAASRTLLQRYTSSPPQLVILSAFKNRHFGLASLSFITLLANLLTVALSGCFVIEDVVLASNADGIQLLSPKMNASETGAGGFRSVGSAIPGKNGEPFQILMSNFTVGTPLPSWTTKERYYLPVNTSLLTEDSEYSMTTLGFQGSLECLQMTESPSDLTYEFSLNSDATQIRYKSTESLSNGTIQDCYASNAFSDTTVQNEDGYYPDTQIFAAGSSSGKKAAEMFMVPKSENSVKGLKHAQLCKEKFVGGWVRADITLGSERSIVNGPASTENLGLNTSATANTTSVDLSTLFISCTPTTYAAKYNVTVDSKGQILTSTEIPDSAFPVDPSITEVAFGSLYIAFQYQADFIYWHSDNLARDWMSFLISKASRSSSLLDPLSPLPTFAELAPQISGVMQRLFALVLSTEREAFLPLPTGTPVPVQKTTPSNRVFLSSAMSKIAVTILLLDALVLAIVYLRLSRPFLPRMPTNIASLVSYFAASHFAAEMGEQHHETVAETVAVLRDGETCYAYGPYMGTDGAPHVGIERFPLARPLEQAQVEGFRKRSRWGS